MPAQIINEAVFQAIFDSIGMGNTWKVLKGRFWTAFRAWGTVIDIWRAETEEELQQVLEKSEADIAEIKARYRDAETQYAKENAVFGSAYGDAMIFYNPALAMSYALVEPLLDETYRADTRRLMKYTGISEWGLTPDFVSKWVDDESKIERQSARATITGPDGETQAVDIFSYTAKTKQDPTQDALNALHGLFITESVSTLSEGPDPAREERKPFTKKDAEELAKVIVSAYESQGVFEKFHEVGKEMTAVKEQIIAEVVLPSTQTLKLLSEMLSAPNIETFTNTMLELSKINNSLKSLNPGDFKQNIKSASEQVMNNPEMVAEFQKETGVEDMTEEIVEHVNFLNARNEFAKNTILLLESVYEENLEFLMEGVTDKGLESMKETDAGKEYAELIQNNIQLLENAIKSLNDLAKKGV